MKAGNPRGFTVAERPRGLVYSGNVDGRVSKVTLRVRRAWLVLGW